MRIERDQDRSTCSPRGPGINFSAWKNRRPGESDELDLIVPQRFFTHQQAKLGDRHVYASRSRFIPDSILGSFATRNWRDQIDGPIEVARKAGSSVDVAASLMRMWR